MPTLAAILRIAMSFLSVLEPCKAHQPEACSSDLAQGAVFWEKCPFPFVSDNICKRCVPEATEGKVYKEAIYLMD